jgi:hypothetical protein
MSYRAPVSEFAFLLEHVAGFPAVAATERFGEATADLSRAIMEEAGKLCEEVLYPLQRAGDQHAAHLENGVVRTPPGFAEGYRAIATGGWVSTSATPDHGGMGLPIALTTAVNEMMSGACLALQIAPLMTQGQIEALEHHASEEIKAIYLPKLISGEWQGTMNLTEPQAGSDVGALAPRPSRWVMAATPSPGRRSISAGVTTTSPPIPVIWCWRAFPMPGRGPRGSACFSCRNSCPTPMANRVRATPRWSASSIRWACMAAPRP